MLILPFKESAGDMASYHQQFCKTFEANQNIQDWGIADLYKPGSSIRDYFYLR
jgi:hypothetical protein